MGLRFRKSVKIAPYVETHTAKKKGSAPGSPAVYSGTSPLTFKVCGIIMMVLAVPCLLLGLISFSVGGGVFVAMGVVFLLLGRAWLRKAKE